MEYCREHDREVFDLAIESAKQRLQNWEPDPDWDETEDDQPSPYLNSYEVARIRSPHGHD